jgi:hypothetical protein
MRRWETKNTPTKAHETHDFYRGSVIPQRCPTPRWGAHKGPGHFQPRSLLPTTHVKAITYSNAHKELVIQIVLEVIHNFRDSQGKITSTQVTTHSKNNEFASKNDCTNSRERERSENLNQNHALDLELISHRRIFPPIEGRRNWGARSELNRFESR